MLRLSRYEGMNLVAGTGVRPSSAVVIICDVSGSMMGTKYHRLRDGLAQILPAIPKASVLAFSDFFRWCHGAHDLPGAGGCTDLASAIAEATLAGPSEILVISDGHPNDADQALAAADAFPGMINVRYVGDDGDTRAIAFMRMLAKRGGGVVVTGDLAKSNELVDSCRNLLGLPAPIAMGGDL